MTIKITDNMTPSLNKMIKNLRKLPEEAFQEFRSNTPVRSGNARRRTRRRGETIEANYAYASKLDQGASKQAPEGMTKPTEEFIRGRLRVIMRKQSWQT